MIHYLTNDIDHHRVNSSHSIDGGKYFGISEIYSNIGPLYKTSPGAFMTAADQDFKSNQSMHQVSCLFPSNWDTQIYSWRLWLDENIIYIYFFVYFIDGFS